MWVWIANHIFWVLGIFGGFGVVGVLVAIFAFGIPGILIVVKLIDFARATIEFFKSPLGMAIGIILIAIGCYLVGDIHRARQDTKYFAAERVRLAKQAEDDRQARDAEIKKKVMADADARLAEIKIEKQQLEGKVEAYEKTLSDRPGCVVTRDDIQRLR